MVVNAQQVTLRHMFISDDKVEVKDTCQVFILYQYHKPA
jgi:hypothetical protein